MPNTQQLEQVRRLSQEITAAISAIERNDLQALQSAIGNQEKISNQLAWECLPVSASGTEQRIIQEAYLELAQLNRVYAGVIKRSKRCADLLLALYGGAHIDREGLACEV